MTDLLIAGGGPAGLGTAILAAQAGLEAVVFEPQASPIDKACGEGLMPPAVAALGRMGVEIPRSYPFHGIRYVDGSAVCEGLFKGGPGLGVRRTVLHAALWDRATALGVRIQDGRVAEFLQASDHVEANGVIARYGVVADGLRSPLRQKLGLQRPSRLPARLGVRRHFQMAPWSAMVEVHWDSLAEAYITPVAEDLVGIAILYPQGADPGGTDGSPFDRWLARFPALREKLGPPANSPRGAGPFEQRVSRRVAGRVALVGDAAGYLDPLTGEGVRLGLSAAERLIAAVQADNLTPYESDWRRLARRYWWSTSALLLAARTPWIRRQIVRVPARFPWIFNGILNGLSAETSPPPLLPTRRVEDRSAS